MYTRTRRPSRCRSMDGCCKTSRTVIVPRLLSARTQVLSKPCGCYRSTLEALSPSGRGRDEGPCTGALYLGPLIPATSLSSVRLLHAQSLAPRPQGTPDERDASSDTRDYPHAQ